MSPEQPADPSTDDIAENEAEALSPDCQSLILEQYKLYVESAESTSERRLKTNSFFLTLHTAVIAIVAYSVYQPSPTRGSVLAIACGVVGVPLCIVWLNLLSSFRRINRCKFTVIGRLEEQLPVSPFWKEEWRLLNHARNADESEDEFSARRLRYSYVPLASVEASIPKITMAAYFLLVVISLSLTFFADIDDVGPNKHQLEPFTVIIRNSPDVSNGMGRSSGSSEMQVVRDPKPMVTEGSRSPTETQSPIPEQEPVPLQTSPTDSP